MLAHHYLALTTELLRPEYDGLTADAAYVLLTERKPQTGGLNNRINTASDAEQRLTRLRFINRSTHDAMPEKHRPKNAFVVDDAIPVNGLPGFPNKVRRAEFDEAWADARGSG